MKKEEAKQLLDKLINAGIRDANHLKKNQLILNSSSSSQGIIVTALQDYERKLDDLITYLEECQFPEEVEVSKYDEQQ